MSSEKKFKLFQETDKLAELGGGEDRIKKQHAAGRKTARERLLDLLDPNTFAEIDKFVTHRSTDFDMDKQKI
ncbi:MAG: methylmalonyl-CoA carboxyltransferase, partial [Bacteroidales bacterium]|nr:methylmalonyl-CoA carboxyltransferase [Bacteroidales bacterium]